MSGNVSADKSTNAGKQGNADRHARLNKGIRGLWDRLTGQHSRTKDQNKREAWQALVRDRQQRESLIDRQLEERQALQENITHVRHEQNKYIEHLKTMIFSALPPEMKARLQEQFEQRQAQRNTPSQRSGHDFELSM